MKEKKRNREKYDSKNEEKEGNKIKARTEKEVTVKNRNDDGVKEKKIKFTRN